MAPSSANAESYAIYGGQDPRELPAYSFADAAQYLKIPLGTLRSWFKGRWYPTRSGDKFFRPVINLPDQTYPFLSFMNLIEAHVLHGIRTKHEVKLFKVRLALDYLNDTFPSLHPLADQWFQTNGIDLFIEECGKLINISRDGQMAMREVLQAYLQRIDRDINGLPIKLYPFITSQQAEHAEEAPKDIVINPLVSFGKPIIAGTGIPTEVIFSLHQAGDSFEKIAQEYGRTTAEIEQAIRYESQFSKRAA